MWLVRVSCAAARLGEQRRGVRWNAAGGYLNLAFRRALCTAVSLSTMVRLPRQAGKQDKAASLVNFGFLAFFSGIENKDWLTTVLNDGSSSDLVIQMK